MLLLNACADSSSINQQSASSYLQIIGQAKEKGIVDKNSLTAKRIHKIFKKCVLMQIKKTIPGKFLHGN